MLAEVAASSALLLRARLTGASIGDVRAGFTAAGAALDVAFDAATAAGTTGRPLARKLRTAREVFILERLSTSGIEVPECSQTTSLDAEAPHIPGVDFERVDPHGPQETHMHGLDLAAALEPRTRSSAGKCGPHATHRRQAPHRCPQPPIPASVH